MDEISDNSGFVIRWERKLPKNITYTLCWLMLFPCPLLARGQEKDVRAGEKGEIVAAPFSHSLLFPRTALRFSPSIHFQPVEPPYLALWKP